MSFESFQLNPCLNANVAELGYVEPTPIQTQTIPVILEGRDVLGLAQTGTGKTAAYALPILHRLLKDGGKGRLRTLILAPTRELAEQIHDDFADLGRQTGLRGVTIYGGVGMQPQVQKLRAGTEIAVACPGRLLDHIRQRTINLKDVEVLVLDEADQMFDMGFLPSIREILRHLPANRQTLLFSATMPEDIRRLATDILRNPFTAQVSRGEPVATVSHALYPVAQHLKTKLLMDLLKHTDTDSVLVFTRTKHRARRVGEQLVQAGYKAASIQGNLAQNRRREVMDGFRSGKYQILVATDIAARGLDIATISHVINYDIPSTVEGYTHRIGRTGRAAKTGDAFTLTTAEDADLVRQIERVLKTSLERRNMEGFDYHAAPTAKAEFARPPHPGRSQGRRPDRNAGPSHRSGPPASGQPRTEHGPRRDDRRFPGARPAHSGNTSRPGYPVLPGSRYQTGPTIVGEAYVPLIERAVVLTSHTAPAEGSGRPHGHARPESRGGYAQNNANRPASGARRVFSSRRPR